MPSAARTGVDLSNCDAEPIHQLGRVQSFGCLIALDRDWRIAHLSENFQAFSGVAPAEAIGRAADVILTPKTLHDIRTRLQWLQVTDSVERMFAVDLFGDGREFDLAVHFSGPYVVVETEPCAAESRIDAVTLVRAMMARLGQTKTLRAALEQAARQVRFVTGFDRVMVYRFLDDDSGEVVAEDLAGGMEPYMGLRYPAADIPKQARALYLRNLLRIIADVDDPGSGIRPGLTPAGAPLDLSMSVLRSVSPIHVEYLKNMGVGASLSISIVVQGRLWGLIACHHRRAHRVSFDRRTAAELFAQMFSLELANREREAEHAEEAEARRIQERLLAAIETDGPLFGNLSGALDRILGVVPAEGVGLWAEGRYALSGKGLTAAEAGELAQVVSARSASGEIFASPALAEVHPPAAAWAARAAGVLAIPVSSTPGDYMMFYRPEKARTVTWAGDPVKSAEIESGRIAPRKSFAAWTEEVRGRAEDWTEGELSLARSLRVTLWEVMIRSVARLEQRREDEPDMQNLLIGELNHRVRNILGLIRGIVAQTGESASSVREFSEMLGGRVQALARAHDQINEGSWSAAPLRKLVATEVEAYLGAKLDRIAMDGPPVALDPQAYACVALVLHEMVTNSAKYGALSDTRGRLAIDWRRSDAGDIVIDWRESDGPPVQAPTRRGFGTTVIERSIPFELGGEADIVYDAQGVRAKFIVPARFAAEARTEESQDMPEAADATLPEGASVLLVEDNVIIALDAEDMLRAIGFADVMVASGAGRALEILKETRPTAALLDVNLGQEDSLPVARALAEMGVPFAFASGYGDTARLAELFPDVKVIGKPYAEAQLRAVALLAAAAG